MTVPQSHHDINPVMADPHGSLMNVVDRLEAIVGLLGPALQDILNFFANEKAVVRARKGKPGRPPKRDALARFAITRRKPNPPMIWKDITVDWEAVHPNDPVTIDTVRSAVRNFENRKKSRRA
jgi:hypothetical protein